jgi:hypothetical protein
MSNCNSFPTTGLFGKRSYSGNLAKCSLAHGGGVPTTHLLSHSPLDDPNYTVSLLVKGQQVVATQQRVSSCLVGERWRLL